MAQLEVVSSKVSFRWRFKKFRLRQVGATAEHVIGQDGVPAHRKENSTNERGSIFEMQGLSKGNVHDHTRVIRCFNDRDPRSIIESQSGGH